MMENENMIDSKAAKKAFDDAVQNALIKKIGSKLLDEEFQKQANSALWEYLEIDEC